MPDGADGCSRGARWAIPGFHRALKDRVARRVTTFVAPDELCWLGVERWEVDRGLPAAGQPAVSRTSDLDNGGDARVG